jgi:hypothetical protein
MEGNGGAGSESDGEEKEDAETKISFYADEHSQSGVDVSELRSMKGSGRAEYESDKDEFENIET